jgi:hypothetical protein
MQLEGKTMFRYEIFLNKPKENYINVIFLFKY